MTTGAGGQNNEGRGVVFHWEDVPPGAVVIAMDTVAESDDPGDVRALQGARARLLAMREEWNYGTLDGPDSTLWGWTGMSPRTPRATCTSTSGRR